MAKPGINEIETENGESVAASGVKIISGKAGSNICRNEKQRACISAWHQRQWRRRKRHVKWHVAAGSIERNNHQRRQSAEMAA
jgi:hypothetical protein